MMRSTRRPAILPASFVACRCVRSEEHTSELQSRSDLVCRLLLEKKKIVRLRSEIIVASANLHLFGLLVVYEFNSRSLGPFHEALLCMLFILVECVCVMRCFTVAI